MDIYIMSPNYELLGVIDYCKSVIWTRRYCAAGDFELYLPVTAQALALITNGNLVMRQDDRSHLMVIQSIRINTDEENGNYITASGPSIESYLSRRIVWSQTNLNGLVTDCVLQLLRDNIMDPVIPDRKIDDIETGSICSCSYEIQKQITGANLLDAVIDLLTTYGLGFELVYQSGKLLFRIYEGTDRSFDQNQNPYVTFSPDFDNLLTSEYLATSGQYKNVALVAGEGEGAARKTCVVGSASGIDRIELFVDAREISSDTDAGTLTDEQYAALLTEKGNETLAENKKQESFEATIAPVNYKLNQDYYLGDTVNLVNEYGIAKITRVKEIIESWDENGYSCIPTFESEEVTG